MRVVRSLTVVVVVCLVAGGVAVAADQFTPGQQAGPRVLSMDGVRVPGAVDPDVYRQEQAMLHGWLVREQVPQAFESAVVVPRDDAKLANVAREAAAGETAERGRLRVGYTAGVGVQIGTSEAWADMIGRQALPLSHGAVRALDGGFVYTAVVRSPGAQGLRLHLTDFFLPEGAELWLYGPDQGAFGPYTYAGPGGEKDFWTHTVAGEVAILQVRYQGPEVESALGACSFKVADIAYLGQPAEVHLSAGAVYRAGSLCSGNASCVQAASGNEGWNDTIALIYFIDGAYWYICSGGAITDANPSSAPYYFLTAHHCISRSKVAKTLEAYWDFTANACTGGGCSGPCSSVPQTLGATLAASGRTGDYTILSLDDEPPLHAYLGWNATPVYNSDGAHLQRLSHPQGSPQGYSKHDVDTSPPAVCNSWPRGPWIYSHDTYGATEGGSSGSPVLNSSEQVVGQLSGGCGYNVNDVCDNTNNSTVDGAFASYYADVAGLLGGSQGPTASFTYSCTGLDCTFDASNSSGSITSYAWDFGDGGVASGVTASHSYSSDGTYTVGLTVTDNGGATDSSSQDVTVGGGGQCAPSGAACSSGADCCSGRCHPKKAYCQ